MTLLDHVTPVGGWQLGCPGHCPCSVQASLGVFWWPPWFSSWTPCLPCDTCFECCISCTICLRSWCFNSFLAHFVHEISRIWTSLTQKAMYRCYASCMKQGVWGGSHTFLLIDNVHWTLSTQMNILNKHITCILFVCISMLCPNLKVVGSKYMWDKCLIISTTFIHKKWYQYNFMLHAMMHIMHYLSFAFRF